MRLLVTIIILISCFLCNLTVSYSSPKPIIVVIDNLLIGGYYNNQWINSVTVSKLIQGGEPYNIYTLKKLKYTLYGSTPIIDEAGGDDFFIEFSCPIDDEDVYVAVGNNNSRLIVPYIKSNTVYKQIVNSFFQENGLNYRIENIEGISINSKNSFDLISVNRYKDTDYIANGYYKTNDNFSFLMLHDGKIKIIDEASRVIVNSNLSKIYKINIGAEMIFGSLYKIVAVLDINNDNNIEIICREEVNEGVIYYIYAYQDGNINKVLSEGIGS